MTGTRPRTPKKKTHKKKQTGRRGETNGNNHEKKKKGLTVVTARARQVHRGSDANKLWKSVFCGFFYEGTDIIKVSSDNSLSVLPVCVVCRCFFFFFFLLQLLAVQGGDYPTGRPVSWLPVDPLSPAGGLDLRKRGRFNKRACVMSKADRGEDMETTADGLGTCPG